MSCACPDRKAPRIALYILRQSYTLADIRTDTVDVRSQLKNTSKGCLCHHLVFSLDHLVEIVEGSRQFVTFGTHQAPNGDGYLTFF